jgi:NagD protein
VNVTEIAKPLVQGAPRSYLIDMDGVIVAGGRLIPGAAEFVRRLKDRGAHFLILTNNPFYTPADLQHRLQVMGLAIDAKCFYTSAMATARFLNSQRPKGTAYVIGESGLTSALHEIGYILTESDPDYVVVGGTNSYNYERIALAVRLVTAGARFIATNSDVSGPGPLGIQPACGALAALIQAATGVAPYFVGKPNPLMMRTALRYLDEHSENTIMVGDRMDTDIVGGIETGMDTILVLTGVTSREDVERFPYRPTWILDSVAAIEV